MSAVIFQVQIEVLSSSIDEPFLLPVIGLTADLSQMSA